MKYNRNLIGWASGMTGQKRMKNVQTAEPSNETKFVCLYIYKKTQKLYNFPSKLFKNHIYHILMGDHPWLKNTHLF